MWAVVKFDRKYLNLMQEDFKKKIGSKCLTYQPKILIQKFSKNKLVNKEFCILNNYVFCYHKKFEDKSTTDKLKFTKGLKYFLEGFRDYQKDIKDFIEKCKSLEDTNGYISQSLFDLDKNTNYKFTSGPFVEKIFKIISFEKNKLNILIGELKTTVNRKDYFFSPL